MPAVAKKGYDAANVLTFKQVMDRLELRKPALYSRIYKRTLNPIKVGGKLLFSLQEVMAEEERVALEAKKKPGKKRFVSLPVPPVSSAVSTSTGPKNEKEVASPPVRADPNDPAGQLASKATKLFNDGKGVRDVVVELCITFAFAKQLYEDWKSCGPEIHLSPLAISILRQRLNWVENPPTPEGLFKAVEDYISFLAETRKDVKKNVPTEAIKSPEKSVERVIPDNIVNELEFDEPGNSQ